MFKSILCSISILFISLVSVLPVFAMPSNITSYGSSYSWVQEGENWAFVSKSGDTVTGWIEYDDKIYYLDKNGIMKTGWLKDNGSWHYFDEDSGELVTDKWVDNYYVNSNGEMTKIR